MREKSKNIIKATFILCISIFFIYLIFKYQSFFKHINFKNLRNYIMSFGPLALLILLLMYSLKPLVIVFPSTLLTVLAGNIFGPVKGFLVTMIGIFFSATLAFYLSRILGKSFVTKITRGKLLKLDESIETYGFRIMFLMRLSMLFPIDPLGYAAGLTRMKYSDFILGTVLGLVPEMAAYSYLGQGLRHPLSKKILIPIILIIVATVGGAYIYKNFSIKKKNTI